jgi:hypothetical protein
MHAYATDSAERTTIPLYIAVFSIIYAWLFSQILAALPWSVPWWIDAPSVAGFYGMIYTVFNRLAWRWRIFRMLGIVKLPNLNGRWSGYFTGPGEHSQQRLEAHITIKQTWTEMSVIFEPLHSRAYSLTGAILTDDPYGIVLTYLFQNEPSVSAQSGLRSHRGAMRLVLRDDGEAFGGEYFTGRDQQTYGEAQFRRQGSS